MPSGIYNRMRKGKYKNCKTCNNLFYVALSELNILFCKKDCYTNWQKTQNDKLANHWTGEKCGYYGKHRWVSRTFGQPKKCENCLTLGAKKYEWANLSKEYKRVRSDWKRLCTHCHRLLDGHANKMWKTRKEQELKTLNAHS